MDTRPSIHPQSRPSSSMNAYGTQASARQTPRLQNSRSTGLGSGNAGTGWAFGAPSAFGALGSGGAPGLGQTRPGQLSGFAQVMGGGSGQAPLDMRDFPSLSGNGPTASNPAVGGWNSSAIRQLTAQQQSTSQIPSQQHQPRAPSAAPSHHSLDHFESQRIQQASGGRDGSGDDFPPLSGQANGNSLGQTNGFGSSIGSPIEARAHLNGQQTQLPIRENQSGLSPSQQAPIGSAQHLSQESSGSQPGSAPSNIKKWADMTEHEKYGMAGLAARLNYRLNHDRGQAVDDTLPSIERQAAMLHQDLASLGMNLDSPDPIYPTFHPFPNLDGSGSVFDVRDREPTPAFSLSESYTVNNVPPLSSRMSSLSDETLLQIFYSKNRGVEQELAAQELSGREWRWHTVLRQWLQRDTRDANQTSSIPLIDHTNGSPIGAAPMRIDNHTERGTYIFLDAPNWRRERRDFTLDHDHLDNRIPVPTAAGALAAGQGSGPLGAALPVPGFVGGNNNGAPGLNQILNSGNWNGGAVGGLGSGSGGERQASVNTGS